MAFYNLRCCVVWRSARCPQKPTCVVHLPGSHSKVRNFNVPVLVKKQIFWLEVTVSDVETMTVVYGGDDLLKIAESFRCGEAASLTEVVKQFTAFDVFEYEVQLRGRFPD